MMKEKRLEVDVNNALDLELIKSELNCYTIKIVLSMVFLAVLHAIALIYFDTSGYFSFPVLTITAVVFFWMLFIQSIRVSVTGGNKELSFNISMHEIVLDNASSGKLQKTLENVDKSSDSLLLFNSIMKNKREVSVLECRLIELIITKSALEDKKEEPVEKAKELNSDFISNKED